MARRGAIYKPTEADRLFVERAVMAGSRVNDIANCLQITDDTLRKHFRYEIMTARERLKGDAVRVLMDSLQDGSLDAAKYVLSRVAGWTERQVVEGPGPNGEHTVKLEDVTRDADEFTSRILRLAAGSAAAGGTGEAGTGS